jgi:SAM-dependent methyltransferase
LGLTQWLGPPPSWLDDPATLQAVHTVRSGPRSRVRLAARLTHQAIQRRVTGQGPIRETKLPKTIHGLREYLLKLEILPKSGEWSNYYKGQNELPTFDPQSSDVSLLAQSTPKHKLLFSIMESCRPKSLLDIGCNTGLYSFMAASLGARAVGLDTDEHAADEMYHAAKARRVDVTAGCGDFVTPLRVAEYLHKPRFRSLHDRVRSDMVLCLAVVHHWVFKRLQLKFADVARILDGVTNNVLVVEFVPPDDQHIRTWVTPTYAWYTQDNFIAALKTAFSRVEVHESFPAPRKLLVCYK